MLSAGKKDIAADEDVYRDQRSSIEAKVGI
jgi:hypothetical protein